MELKEKISNILNDTGAYKELIALMKVNGNTRLRDAVDVAWDIEEAIEQIIINKINEIEEENA